MNENYIGRDGDQIKIVILNVQNIKHHISDIKHHHVLHDQNLLIFSETWLSITDLNDANHPYKIPGYEANYCIAGNGKGIVGYAEKTFQPEQDIVRESHQIIKYSTSFQHKSGKNVFVDVIGVYRSTRSSNDNTLLSDIKRMIDFSRVCLISGDFNLDVRKQSNNVILKELRDMKFTQMIDYPTHVQGGIIDHLHVFCPKTYNNVMIESDLIAPFYSDHFGICINIYKGENTFKHIASSVPDDLIQPVDSLHETRTPSRKWGQTTFTSNKTSKRKRAGSPEKSKPQNQ